MNEPRRFLVLHRDEDGEQVAATGCQFGDPYAADPNDIYVLKWTGSIEIIADLIELQRSVRPGWIRWLDA